MEKNISINYREDYEGDDTATKVKYYLEMLKKRAQLEAEAKAMSKYLTRLDQHITDEMMDEGIGSLEVDGIKFAVTSDDQFSLDKETVGTDKWDNDMFFKLLQESGNEALIKLKESVHPATRKAFLKEQLKRGTELPSWIVHKLFTHLKFNKAEVERQAEGGE